MRVRLIRLLCEWCERVWSEGRLRGLLGNWELRVAAPSIILIQNADLQSFVNMKMYLNKIDF